MACPCFLLKKQGQKLYSAKRHLALLTMSLADLGWTNFFSTQLIEAKQQGHSPARVTGVARTGLSLNDGKNEFQSKLGNRWYRDTIEDQPVIGDWVLVNQQLHVTHLLVRRNVLSRIAPNTSDKVQSIVANVDILFVVSSCNEEFNESRIERFLSLASSANVKATIVLTKIDLTEEQNTYLDRAQKLTSNPILLVNATAQADCQNLLGQLGHGRTASLIGSSGVGKSTIVNGLMSQAIQKTQPNRSIDGKGMHTTTSRSLHVIPSGGVIIDSPGVREIALVEEQIDLSSSFEDIQELATQCRFNDCRHDQEPDCAIHLAVESGELDARRWESFLRLSNQKPVSR